MLYAYTVWLTPLWSAFPGLSVGLFFMLATIKLLTAGSLSALLYGTGLPSSAALLAWRYNTRFPRIISVFIPVVAFALFALHVGFTAHLVYAAYWLILPVLYLSAPSLRGHILVRALTASMSAHIVGALLVAALGSFSAWSSLVAVVPFERMIAVAGMLVTAGGMYGMRLWGISLQRNLVNNSMR